MKDMNTFSLEKKVPYSGVILSNTVNTLSVMLILTIFSETQSH